MSDAELRRELEIKVNRAVEHIETLEKEISTFLESGAIDIQLVETETPGHWQLFLDRSEHPPKRWGAVVGDAIHNLRSSLDVAMYGYLQLAYPEGWTQMNANHQRRIQFPICEKGDDLRSKCWHAGLADTSLRQVLRSHQPYFWAQFAPSPDKRREVIETTPLWQLNDLWNRDKHRQLTPIGAYPSMLALGLGPGVEPEWRFIADADWSGSTLISEIVVPAGTSPQKFELIKEFKIALQDDGRPLHVYPIVDKLRAFHQVVVAILTELSFWYRNQAQA